MVFRLCLNLNHFDESAQYILTNRIHNTQYTIEYTKLKQKMVAHVINFDHLNMQISDLITTGQSTSIASDTGLTPGGGNALS